MSDLTYLESCQPKITSLFSLLVVIHSLGLLLILITCLTFDRYKVHLIKKYFLNIENCQQIPKALGQPSQTCLNK